MLKSKWSYLIGQTHSDEGEEKIKSEEGVLHIPKTEFLWKEPKQEVYETRNCYPEQSLEQIKELNEKLDKLILTTSLVQPLDRVGIVYDDLMLKHRNGAEP